MLTGSAVAQLWQQMERLDALVAQARRDSTPQPAPAFAAPAVPPDPASVAREQDPMPPGPPVATAPPTFPAPAAPQVPASAPRQGLDVGSVILALGALLLLVAATIFISVSWDRLGLFGRSMVLFGATVVAAAAAAATTRRRLGASSEALWAVAFGLLTLDWFAARAEGLFALDAVPGQIHVGGWSVLLALLALPVARIGHAQLGRELVTPQVAAGVGPLIAGPAVFYHLWVEAEWTAFWSGAGAGLLVGLVVAIAWRLRTTIALWIAVPAGVATTLFLIVTALVEAFASPGLDGLVVNGHGAPLAVVAIVSAVAALVLPRGAWIAAAAALAAMGTLALTAVLGESSATVVAVVASAAIAAGGVLIRGTSSWARGTQACVVAAAAAATTVVLAAWSGEVREPVAVAALSLGVAAAAWGARRWASIALPQPLVRSVIIAVVLVGLSATMAAAELPEAVRAGVAIAAAVVIMWRLGGGNLTEQCVGPAALLLALLPASSDVGVAAWAYAVIALAFGFHAATTREDVLGAVTAVLAALTGGAAGVALSGWAGLDERAASLWLVLAGVAAFGAASWFVESMTRRVPLEVTAALLAFAGVLAGLDAQNASWMAFLFLVLALTLFAAVADVADRRWCALPAAVLAALSWICFIVGEEIASVEAVTVPLAAIALGVGVWFLRRDASTRTFPALGLGLALAVLPSLPQALADPTSLRAVLLGTAALIALALGWWRSWQAPFVVGTMVLALLVIVNLWPLAMAVERWVLFGLLGVALLAIGVTWESRVRQGRAALRIVASMR
ncbi:SCO7613 C-terminal domain-containing membrane protein [uncultured Aeromicrobium sp.]|uniref:SCO7613 C-terminal domain-containing membrane protein n=1 Tax=uncultured Aeromicrobium sp. TaxID=337820 RepID=UPI0025FBAA40|nr:hypothetical protein [uncultured Aeromicrobium sp.]